jgi:hypothetical protein
VEVGEILLGDNSDLVIAGNTIFVTLTEGNFGWDITDPANPAYLGMFGSVISHAGWGNRYVTCTPEWLLDPGESVDLLFYEREGSADWQLMDQRPIPCEFTGHWNDLLTLAGDTIAAQCDGEDEIHLFQWNADANELIGKGVLSESFIHVADQLVGLDTGIIMVRGPSDFTVVNVSTEPYEIVWEGVSGQGNPSLHERTARLVGSRLWVPTGPDYSAGVFDIQAPFNSLPLLSLPAPGQTIDVRKGIAVQGHGDYHGFRVYDVSGCW